MSKAKPFGYPVTCEHLAHFLDPDGGRPLLWEDHTYFQSAHWTLRTTQATAAVNAPSHPLTPAQEAIFARFPQPTEKDWVPIDTIAPILNKFPARIWERTQFRHHLQTYPLVSIGAAVAQRGILQLASRLPRAEICTSLHFHPFIAIRFRSGELLLHPLPFHYRAEKISLRFFQPKHDPMR
jgi:hypothetical protein